MTNRDSSVNRKNTSKSARQVNSVTKGQAQRFPMMSRQLKGLTLFFFIVSFIQMAYLHWKILQVPEVNLDQTEGDALALHAETFADRAFARELEIRSEMEVFIVTQRYHQAGVQLMSGLWTRYLGFITGMILALVGASFILGKLREPSQKLEGRFSGFGFLIRTASPGIILAVLGTTLMLATILDKDVYEVKDSNTYLFRFETSDLQGNGRVPILPPPEEAFEIPTTTP